ncbi:MAG: hypothetical protein M2R45_02948 [Verrucomicrobia subdivision 3 bacterium]|nr:hypothetical protein [Limisphaerales bacterium]MCS1415332.1 hypothetical protein [Limisphaerales bacterium]
METFAGKSMESMADVVDLMWKHLRASMPSGVHFWRSNHGENNLMIPSASSSDNPCIALKPRKQSRSRKSIDFCTLGIARSIIVCGQTLEPKTHCQGKSVELVGLRRLGGVGEGVGWG